MPGAVGADPTPLEPLLPVPEVARLLGICSKSVRKHIDAHELRAVRVGSRVLVDPADIRTYKEARATALVSR